MNNLSTRVFSAVAAIVLFALAYGFGHNMGVLLVAGLACFVGCYEYMRLTLNPIGGPKLLRTLFLTVCALLFFVLVLFDRASLPAAVLLIVYFVFCALWILAKSFDNAKMLVFISYSVLGFFYSVFLPSIALKLLLLPKGEFWFLFLLGIVFCGDIAAYFGGIAFGKNKIMPTVSPSKTIAGAVSGLIGSLVFAMLFTNFVSLPISLSQVIFAGLVGGVIAQSGDLFESLMKRVAAVKDSGQIMPGHGGSLDRFDGVYFAAPLIYALAIGSLG